MQGCLLVPHSSKAYVDAVSLTHRSHVEPCTVVHFSQGAQQELPHPLIPSGQHLQDHGALHSSGTSGTDALSCVRSRYPWPDADVGAGATGAPGVIVACTAELLLPDGDRACIARRAAVVQLVAGVCYRSSAIASWPEVL